MTIGQIEDTLPNGFHDAEMFSIQIDYERGIGALVLQVDLEDSVAKGELILSGIQFVEVQSPDPGYPFTGSGSVELSGCETTEEILSNFSKIRSVCPLGTFFYSFFVRTWNSFVHIAATSAEFRWIQSDQKA